jgi:hypothetical protein
MHVKHMVQWAPTATRPAVGVQLLPLKLTLMCRYVTPSTRNTGGASSPPLWNLECLKKTSGLPCCQQMAPLQTMPQAPALHGCSAVLLLHTLKTFPR